MKKIVTLLFLFAMTTEFCKAQTYHKLLDNSEWFQAILHGFGISNTYYWYYQDGDTSINSTTYTKIQGSYLNYKFYLREDTITRKVYTLTSDTTESILYDFSMGVGDSLLLVDIGNIPNNKVIKVAFIDTTATGQGYRKRFKMCLYINSTLTDTFFIIEGVGSLSDPLLLYNWVQDPIHSTVCSYQNQVSVFHNPYFSFPCPVRNAPCNMTAAITGTDFLCDTLCNGVLSVSLQGTAIPPFEYYWSNGGGFASSNLTGLCYGFYGVSISDGLGCFASAWHSIIQNPTMNLSFTTTLDSGSSNGTATASINGGIPPYSFLWSNSSTSSSIIGLTTGTYYLTVTDSLGCSIIDSAVISASIATSISENAYQLKLKINPNPFSAQLTFSLADNVQTTISLYNFLGQRVLQQIFTNSTTISTGQLADGIYFYELRNDKGTLKTGKLVKQ